MKIKYISNTSLKESSGGGSGVNFATYNFLKDLDRDIEFHVIMPEGDVLSKIISVIKRKFGRLRNYHFFSEKRLKSIENQFEGIKKTSTKPDLYFFHGFTQWIKTKPDKAYYCFNDACFATYIDIYNNPEEFSSLDLERIFSQEKEWLSNAKNVFFRSQWALEATKKAYDYKHDNLINVGVGGFIDIPKEDSYKTGYKFLFIAREFIPKGGLVVAKAISELRQVHTNVSLQIVGEDPGEEVKCMDGINYLGFFNKQVKQEEDALKKIFSESFALVHPTLKDTNTLVINELAYFGCPAIASNKFAIPEYLIHEKSGFLVNDPRDILELKELMKTLVNMDATEYLKMRAFTRSNAIVNNTWEQVGKRISNHIKS